jgi:hypothetical protein
LRRFFVGLDLGQAQDYTAIAVIEAAPRPVLHDGVSSGEELLHVRHLERFRHRLYPDVADHVQALLDREPLRSENTELIIDATGVGPAVTDIFQKRGVDFQAVKIHGGDAEKYSPEDGSWRVPKRNLVSALQVLLQTSRLKIAGKLELAGVLKEELLNFRVKVNVATAHDSYEAWREGDHDDLVLATALACWASMRPGPVMTFIPFEL